MVLGATMPILPMAPNKYPLDLIFLSYCPLLSKSHYVMHNCYMLSFHLNIFAICRYIVHTNNTYIRKSKWNRSQSWLKNSCMFQYQPCNKQYKYRAFFPGLM